MAAHEDPNDEFDLIITCDVCGKPDTGSKYADFIQMEDDRMLCVDCQVNEVDANYDEKARQREETWWMTGTSFDQSR